MRTAMKMSTKIFTEGETIEGEIIEQERRKF